MINAISAADIAFIMSSSTSACPLECSPQKHMSERFASVSEDELCEKCIIIIISPVNAMGCIRPPQSFSSGSGLVPPFGVHSRSGAWT